MYKPLKKTIKFSDRASSNPEFETVKIVIKTLADVDFKQWLIDYIANYLATLPYSENSRVSNLKTISYTIKELVSRDIAIDSNEIAYSRTVFKPEPNWAAIDLLANMMEFLLNLQIMEREVQNISNCFAKNEYRNPKQMTRNGQVPSYLPRNRQQYKK